MKTLEQIMTEMINDRKSQPNYDTGSPSSPLEDDVIEAEILETALEEWHAQKDDLIEKEEGQGEEYNEYDDDDGWNACCP